MKQINTSFPIFIKKLKQHDDVKDIVLQHINEQESCEELVGDGNNITRVDWHTSRFDNNRPWVRVLGSLFGSYILEWGDNFGYSGFEVAEMWFQQYEKNAIHNWHVHGCNFTGVYYLELPDDAAKTEYLDPCNFEATKTFDVEEGDIILFPSYILHRSPPNLSNSRKTIVSWNFNIRIPTGLGL
jgi:hypothetical protein